MPTIPVSRFGRNVWHVTSGATCGVILASGTYGGVAGPSDIYEELAVRLKANGITCVRLDYAELHKVDSGVNDVLAAIEELDARGVRQVVLVGWSFGAAVVVNAGVRSENVVAVAMIASHEHRAEAIAELAPRSLLLIHCRDDKVMSVKHAEALYDTANEPKELVLFEGGDHFFSEHRTELTNTLLQWCSKTARQDRDILGRNYE